MGEDRRSAAADRPPTEEPTGNRLTIPDAAEALGISPEAVRSRARRGTLASVREGGRVYVTLAGPDRRTAQDRPASRPADRDALIDALTGQVEYLRDQLDQERQAHGEARRLLAAALERIPAIEAPPDAAGSPETGAAEPEGAEPRSATGGAQEGARRPWWRRVFGG